MSGCEKNLCLWPKHQCVNVISPATMIPLSRFSRIFLCLALSLLLIMSTIVFQAPSSTYRDFSGALFGESSVNDVSYLGVHGDVIMGKLGNETAKAALGRATWKLLHTMTLRYPENPTPDEREALSAYFHLSARLYPCGECATEFQALLKKYPPQTSSRKSASFWLCFVHNLVNERLGKPEFDCTELDSTYDCGCGDGPVASDKNEQIMVDDETGYNLMRGG